MHKNQNVDFYAYSKRSCRVYFICMEQFGIFREEKCIKFIFNYVKTSIVKITFRSIQLIPVQPNQTLVIVTLRITLRVGSVLHALWLKLALLNPTIVADLLPSHSGYKSSINSIQKVLLIQKWIKMLTVAQVWTRKSSPHHHTTNTRLNCWFKWEWTHASENNGMNLCGKPTWQAVSGKIWPAYPANMMHSKSSKLFFFTILILSAYGTRGSPNI